MKDTTRSTLGYQTRSSILHNLELAVNNPATQAHQADKTRGDALAHLTHTVQTTLREYEIRAEQRSLEPVKNQM